MVEAKFFSSAPKQVHVVFAGLVTYLYECAVSLALGYLLSLVPSKEDVQHKILNLVHYGYRVKSRSQSGQIHRQAEWILVLNTNYFLLPDSVRPPHLYRFRLKRFHSALRKLLSLDVLLTVLHLSNVIS